MPGFERIDLDRDENPRRLRFVSGTERVLLTPEQQIFKGEITTIESRLRNLFPAGQVRDELFQRLKEVATMGLVGTDPDVAGAAQSLGDLKDEIGNAGVELRRRHLAENWHYAPWPFFGGIALTAAWIALVSNLPRLYGLTTFTPETVNVAVNAFGAVGFALLGLAIGVTFMAHFTNLNITYDSIEKISKYKFTVPEYYRYLYLLLAVVLVLLFFDVVQVGVAQILLNDMKAFPVFGLFAGLVCSVTEPAIANLATGALSPRRRDQPD